MSVAWSDKPLVERTFHLSNSLEQRLLTKAADLRVNVSHLVRVAVEYYLEHLEQANR